VSLQPHLWSSAACGLAVFLLGVAFYGKKRLSGTTLTAPCLWVAISALCLAVLAIAEVLHTSDQSTIGMSAMRFAVAASALCPLIAVLGAKRPQDKGWQWVVFTLWLVLIWPAGQAVVNPAGPRLEIFAAWRLFLWGLIMMGPLNYLPTRHWIAALLVAAGQLILFGEFLRILEHSVWQLPAAVGCFLLAAMTVALQSPTRANGERPFPEQSQRWLSFRDSFGAFWGLRIMQRVNETAAVRAWPVELTWSGFEKVKEETDMETVAAEIDHALDTLLRRFF
jgi:hypothetical protein